MGLSRSDCFIYELPNPRLVGRSQLHPRSAFEIKEKEFYNSRQRKEVNLNSDRCAGHTLSGILIGSVLDLPSWLLERIETIDSADLNAKQRHLAFNN